MDESVVKHLEQPTKTLKLSEAIRIGARMRPQCAGDFFLNGGSCALGAALEAFGIDPKDAKGFHYGNACDILGITEGLAEHIAIRNDLRHWSRESIADWLESIGY